MSEWKEFKAPQLRLLQREVDGVRYTLKELCEGTHTEPSWHWIAVGPHFRFYGNAWSQAEAARQSEQLAGFALLANNVDPDRPPPPEELDEEEGGEEANPKEKN